MRFCVLAEWISRQDGPNLTRKDSQNKYNDSLDKAIKELKKKDKGWIIGDIGAWKVFQIKNSHKTWDDIRYHHTNLRQWLDIDNEINWSQWKMKRLESILEGDNGYVWVFSALYSSLLNAGKNFTLSEAWIYSGSYSVGCYVDSLSYENLSYSDGYNLIASNNFGKGV